MVVSFVVILVAASALGSFYLASNKQESPTESVTLGLMSIELEGLIYVANERGYFSDNGLNITIKDYVSGLAAVNGLLNGEVDIATATDFVLVGKALFNESIVSIGNIDKFSIGSVMVRTDHGINNVMDLKGKRIGIAMGTVAEYNLVRFLESSGIEANEVTLVNIPPLLTPAALTNGSVDAAYTTKAYFEMAIGPIPGDILVWAAQNDRLTNYLAISDREWARDHLETTKRFFRALSQAEDFMIGQTDISKEIVRIALNDTNAYVQQVWPDNQFSLSLDQTLILSMEDQSRWMIRNNISTGPVPNFLKYLNTDGLESVDPGAVTIIR